ncbi:MAG TPA: hypothetical protein VF803_02785 [Candidatus Paceibacterota bacterium]
MMNVYKVICAGAIAMTLPLCAMADTVSDLHIGQDGTVTGTGITVMQKSGTSNFFTRAVWGNAFVRITVLAHDDTAIVREHGESATSDTIQAGDIIDFDGVLAGGDALTVNAKHIRDHTLTQATKTLSGTIQSVNATGLSFVLSNKTYGKTTIFVPITLMIQKGARTISFADLVVGDKVLSVSGVYDYAGNGLNATAINVYQNPSLFVRQNFQGTLRGVSGSVLPATLTLSVGNTNYTVSLATTTSLLSNSRASTQLARFQVGDTVRIFGAIRPTDLSTIDATIARDISF